MPVPIKHLIIYLICKQTQHISFSEEAVKLYHQDCTLEDGQF